MQVVAQEIHRTGSRDFWSGCATETLISIRLRYLIITTRFKNIAILFY
jgi:hypothetical protein